MTPDPQSRPASKAALLDGAAIFVSAACLVHCLLLPLLFAFLPAASQLFGLSEGFHLVAFLFAIPASGLAMAGGYRLHGARLPASLGAIGLLLIGLGALGGFELLLETGVTVAGSLLLAVGHLGNWRLRTRMIRAGDPSCDDVMSHDSAGEKTCVSAG